MASPHLVKPKYLHIPRAYYGDSGKPVLECSCGWLSECECWEDCGMDLDYHVDQIERQAALRFNGDDTA